MRRLQRVVATIAFACLAWNAQPVYADEGKEGRKPPTKVTEKISPQVFMVMGEAQKALEAKELGKAESLLNELLEKLDELNDYEKAQLYNFLAAVHYEQGRSEQTIKDYIAIVKLENPPEQIFNNSLFRLAQLYFVEEDYDRSSRILDKWMSLQTGSIRPEAYMLKAQAYYQQDKYAEAEAPILDALREAKARDQELQESWLALLRAVYYEQGKYPEAVKVLGVLVGRWPKANYYKQLAGMLGLMKHQEGQLYFMHAAYIKGMLENESELLNLARLYMATDVPYPAIDVIEEGFESGAIEETASNLQLLAQAMSLAKDSEGQIPVLQKAARLSGEAKQYMYLGQAQIAVYDWEAAADSLQKALEIGGLERPGSVQMQIGTAYFNLKRYSRSLQAFKEAAAYDGYREQAQQWVRFIKREVEREQAIGS